MRATSRERNCLWMAASHKCSCLLLIDHCVAAAGAFTGSRAGGKHKVALIEQSSAPPIDQHGICRPLSLLVDEHYARALGSEVPVAPGGQRDENRPKIAALFGQNIFIARRVLAVAAALQKTGVDQSAQASR